MKYKIIHLSNRDISGGSSYYAYRVHKYFRSLKIPTENRHLYDLKIDPFEGNNLVEKNSAKVNEMEKLLENIRNETNFCITHEKYDDEEAKRVEEELKKLGYI